MHENLKSTISLQPSQNEQGENNLWQTLVPAYEYGTFFVLYGKFRGEYVPNEPKKFRIREADFYLQNYQGLITIGLMSIEEEIDVLYDLHTQAPVYVLKVQMKALETKSKIEAQSLKVKLKPSIRNYKDTSDTAPHRNWTNPDNELNLDIPLQIALIYEKLDPSYFDPADISKCKIIDGRRYQRDGDQLLRRKYQIVNLENPVTESISGDKSAGADINESSGTIENYKCYPTYARLI